MGDNTEILKKRWSRNKLLWLYGLGSATILGISHSVTPVLVAPETFNLSGGLKKLIIIIIVSGLLGAFTFLSKSPLPALPKEFTEENSEQ